jgi:hypothetical protein
MIGLTILKSDSDSGPHYMHLEKFDFIIVETLFFMRKVSSIIKSTHNINGT